MPTPTYTPLANITLGSSAASVTFSSISQAYRDLVLVVRGTNSSGSGISKISFNGDSSSNYSMVYMEGSGTTTYSNSETSSGINTSYNLTIWSSTQNIITYNIMDYSAVDKHKLVLCRAGSTYEGTTGVAGRWANTAAITSIVVDGTTFASGTSMAIYGIAA